MPLHIMIKSKAGTLFSCRSVLSQYILQDHQRELSVVFFPVLFPFMSPQSFLENDGFGKWHFGNGIHSLGDN